MQESGQTVYRLGLGQSPFPVPPSVVEALRVNAFQKDYLPASGLPELREAVAAYHHRNNGVVANGSDVLVGPGSKELMFLLQLTFYGELIVPTPCWVSYVPQARILSRKVSLIHTRVEDQWRMTAERLEKHCAAEKDRYRPRVLILNYPGNPEGRSYNADELKELAFVSCKYRVILLSDEIYGELHHKGEHVSISQYCPERTIISSGLSKWCGAGGWRLGTFTFPTELSWLREAMAAVASETFTSVCAPIQHAAVRAFQGGEDIDTYLRHSRRILGALGNRCADIIAESGIKVFPPVGAFYLFLDFTPLADNLSKRGINDSATLCERLLEETGVALLPGESFERPPGELTARMAYVDFDGAAALKGSEKVPLAKNLPDDFPDKLCPKVVTASRLIGEWAAS